MWLSAHIQVVNGKPQFKHPSKQYKDPKILTLTTKIDNGSLDCLLDLGNGDSKPVRCYDLRSSATPTDMDILLGGFGHMADKWQDDDDEGDRWEDFDEVDFDENEFEDQIVDDSNGLEGHDHVLGIHVRNQRLDISSQWIRIDFNDYPYLSESTGPC